MDLVEDEDGFRWISPDPEHPFGVSPCASSLLVDAIMATGLVTTSGLEALTAAWDGFDPAVDSHATEWASRTAAAIAHVGSTTTAAARWTIESWPMPMVEVDVERIRTTDADLQAERDRLEQSRGGDVHRIHPW